MDIDPGRLLGALELAARKHRDQRRKDRAASPYINHPIQVAALLWDAGVRDEATLLAAILHDTIEDTATTDPELRAAFGDAVADIVGEVTDDKSLPKTARKQLQIEHAPHLSRAAKLVKMADKTCNVRDVIDDPPEGWSQERRRAYLDWARAVVDGVRDASPELAARFDREHARGVD